jgi:hypothetical protein
MVSVIYANDDGGNVCENDDNNKHNNSTLFQCLLSILITDYEFSLFFINLLSQEAKDQLRGRHRHKRKEMKQLTET